VVDFPFSLLSHCPKGLYFINFKGPHCPLPFADCPFGQLTILSSEGIDSSGLFFIGWIKAQPVIHFVLASLLLHFAHLTR